MSDGLAHSGSPTTKGSAWKNFKKVAKEAVKQDQLAFPDFDFDGIPSQEAILHTFNVKEKKWSQSIVYAKIEPHSFAHGAQRSCHRMKQSIDPDWRHPQNCVAKKFIKGEDHQQFFEDAKVQLISKYYGELYNTHTPPKKVDFLSAYVLEVKPLPNSDSQTNTFYALEHFIEGDYQKYNNNAGFVSEDNRNTPNAFSHFSYEESGGALLIVDIQGVGDLYTDPQIHTWDGYGHGNGNLGIKGMALFFHTHRCNPICHKLNLKPCELYGKRTVFKLSSAWKGTTMTQSLAMDMGADLFRRQRSLARMDSTLKTNIPVLELDPSVVPTFDLTVEPPSQDELLAMLQFEIAVSHETGYFTPPGEPTVTDPRAAFHHYQKAGQMGHVLAQLGVARVFSGLGRDILPDVDAADKRLCVEYLRLAAERGSFHAMVNLAKIYETFENSFGEAVKWYTKSLEIKDKNIPIRRTTKGTESSTQLFWWDDSTLEDYEINANIGRLYQVGGPGLEPDYAYSAECYRNAAEQAQVAFKGKMASKFYMMAEEVEALIE